MTEDSLNERARDVERVVKAASEPATGEFLVPLSSDRVDAMRVEMEGIEAGDPNEGFLSTVDSWMNKAHQDGMDGMVAILQKALQIYAGTVISRARMQLQANVGAALVGDGRAAADALVAKLLSVDADGWNAEIRRGWRGRTA